MRIRAKLILSNIIVVAFSVLVVSLPVLFLQTRELKSNIEQSAIQNMAIASSDISAFLKKSKVIINDMASYLQANAVEEQTSINTFIDAISDDKSIFALYYVDTIPMRNGGIFYSSDYWLPEDDYDKTTRDWYSQSIASQKVIVTAPYVDATTGSLVTSIAKLQTLVSDIKNSKNDLGSVESDLQARVQDAASSITEILSNIESVGNPVSNQADAVQQTSAAVAEIAENINSLENMISRQSEGVSQASAAVEAAHAGEAGKGFSVVASSQESNKSFYDVNTMISRTDDLVRQIHAAMEEQQEGSRQIVESLKIMNDNTTEVRTASHEMAEGNRLILDEVHNLQDTTLVIKQSMKEMSIRAREMNGTSSALSEISSKVRDSIKIIGSEIDQFKV